MKGRLSLYPGPDLQVDVSQSQAWPALQQLVQPHRVLSGEHRGTQV